MNLFPAFKLLDKQVFKFLKSQKNLTLYVCTCIKTNTHFYKNEYLTGDLQCFMFTVKIHINSKMICYILSLGKKRACKPTPALLSWRIPWTEEPGRLWSIG